MIISMYKVIFKVNKGFANNSSQSLRKIGFIPIYRKIQGDYDMYMTLFKGNNLAEVKEAISEAAFYFAKEGKFGRQDFATIYEVDDKYLGKGIGSLLGAGLGYKIAGLPGLILGLLGGVIIGELADITLGEKFVGVMEWPKLSY